MRLNFEISDERAQEIKDLQTETGTESMKELFNNAFSLLEWTVKEVKNGHEIAAINRADQVYRVFITPLLERVARKHGGLAVARAGSRSVAGA
jgi:hypothetical protein